MEPNDKENFPDDLNEWSQENFDMMRQLFRRTCSRKTVEETQEEMRQNGLDRIINKDDLTNLKIDLSKIDTIEDFLKGM